MRGATGVRTLGGNLQASAGDRGSAPSRWRSAPATAAAAAAAESRALHSLSPPGERAVSWSGNERVGGAGLAMHSQGEDSSPMLGRGSGGSRSDPEPIGAPAAVGIVSRRLASTTSTSSTSSGSRLHRGLTYSNQAQPPQGPPPSTLSVISPGDQDALVSILEGRPLAMPNMTTGRRTNRMPMAGEIQRAALADAAEARRRLAPRQDVRLMGVDGLSLERRQLAENPSDYASTLDFSPQVRGRKISAPPSPGSEVQPLLQPGGLPSIRPGGVGGPPGTGVCRTSPGGRPPRRPAPLLPSERRAASAVTHAMHLDGRAFSPQELVTTGHHSRGHSSGVAPTEVRPPLAPHQEARSVCQLSSARNPLLGEQAPAQKVDSGAGYSLPSLGRDVTGRTAAGTLTPQQPLSAFGSSAPTAPNPVAERRKTPEKRLGDGFEGLHGFQLGARQVSPFGLADPRAGSLRGESPLGNEIIHQGEKSSHGKYQQSAVDDLDTHFLLGTSHLISKKLFGS